jgi:hypothetical protein
MEPPMSDDKKFPFPGSNDPAYLEFVKKANQAIANNEVGRVDKIEVTREALDQARQALGRGSRNAAKVAIEGIGDLSVALNETMKSQIPGSYQASQNALANMFAGTGHALNSIAGTLKVTGKAIVAIAKDVPSPDFTGNGAFEQMQRGFKKSLAPNSPACQRVGAFVHWVAIVSANPLPRLGVGFFGISTTSFNNFQHSWELLNDVVL